MPLVFYHTQNLDFLKKDVKIRRRPIEERKKLWEVKTA
jgi:hypothetical protein